MLFGNSVVPIQFFISFQNFLKLTKSTNDCIYLLICLKVLKKLFSNDDEIHLLLPQSNLFIREQVTLPLIVQKNGLIVVTINVFHLFRSAMVRMTVKMVKMKIIVILVAFLFPVH